LLGRSVSVALAVLIEIRIYMGGVAPSLPKLLEWPNGRGGWLPFRAVCAQTWRAVNTAQVPHEPESHSPQLLARSVRDFARAAELVVGVIDTLIALSGTAGFATSHPIQRAWRDIHFASMHVSLNTENNYAHFGRTELGFPRDPNQPFF
jgi:hypothetical protein